LRTMGKRKKKSDTTNVIPFPSSEKIILPTSAEMLARVTHQMLEDLGADKATVRVNAGRVLAQIALADKNRNATKEEEIVIAYSDISLKPPDKEPVPNAGA